MEKLRIPKDLWLKFGCFLSGHNYNLLSECSETSKKYVRKLTSALLIICIIWGFVGYLFATRYAETSYLGGIIGSFFAAIIIIQIERQIILGSSKYIYFTMGARLILGFIVAIIGALILDQVFFKNDIAKKKEDLIENRIFERTQAVREKSNKTLAQYDSTISLLNNQIIKNNVIISKAGFRYQTGSQTVTTKTNTNEQDSKIQTTSSNSFGSHPLLQENENLRQQIAQNNFEKVKELNALQKRIDEAKTKARNEPPGFLDELNIVYELAASSGISAFAYCIFLGFFIFIELFIVIAKFSDGENDYYKIISFQEKIREERLIALETKRSSSLGADQIIDESNKLVGNMPK